MAKKYAAKTASKVCKQLLKLYHKAGLSDNLIAKNYSTHN